MDLGKTIEQMAMSSLAKLGLAWWVKVSTKFPRCTYYLGLFVSAKEAKLAQSSYLERLENEGATGSTMEIVRCQPKGFSDIEKNESGVTPLSNFLDLILPIINEEIENVLETYPDHFCQSFFAIPQWYGKLVTYVLPKIPRVGIVIENPSKSLAPQKIPTSSLEFRLDVESWVRSGIQLICQENFNPLLLHSTQKL
ncbi:MAG: DUF1816 domain-containing protein [Kastovskya adunca ATA6-11-RM4]|jgi:hypothetical protein|nr:DUF1816 domain-containing protein [Kastovskya adunca ATA6-11-RM4]